MDLGLVSCSKSKRIYACKASEMYFPSALFRKSFSYAERKYDVVGILSAKYGFLLSDDHIEPYNLTLNKMHVQDRLRWAERVFVQMKKRLNMADMDRTFFHVGEKYREFLIPRLAALSVECIIPLEGLSFGEQLAWYDKQETLDWRHCS